MCIFFKTVLVGNWVFCLRFIWLIAFSVFHGAVDGFRVVAWLFVFLIVEFPLLAEVGISGFVADKADQLDGGLHHIGQEEQGHADDNDEAEGYFRTGRIAFPDHDEEGQHAHYQQLHDLAAS